MWSDRLPVGLVAGLLAPVLGFALYGLIYITAIHPEHSFRWYVTDLFLGTPEFRSKILSLSLIADVPLFFWFDRRDRHQAMRGVIGAMFIYGIAIVILW
jgi:hypothetical protein